MHAAGMRVETSKGEVAGPARDQRRRADDGRQPRRLQERRQELAHQHGCSITFMAKPDRMDRFLAVHTSPGGVTRAPSPGRPPSSRAGSPVRSPTCGSWRSSSRRTSTRTSATRRGRGRRPPSPGGATTARAASASSVTEPRSGPRRASRGGREPVPRLRGDHRRRSRGDRAGTAAAGRSRATPTSPTPIASRTRCERRSRPGGGRDRAGGVRRRGRRPLPQLCAHRAGALRSRGDELRAAAVLRAW